MSLNINQLQHDIMLFIGDWTNEKKSLIPREEILTAMENNGVKSYTAINAINSLIRKGYIRRSSVRTNKTYYIKLRSV